MVAAMDGVAEVGNGPDDVEGNGPNDEEGNGPDNAVGNGPETAEGSGPEMVGITANADRGGIIPSPT